MSNRDREKRIALRVRTSREPDHEEDLKGMSVDQLLGMMWQLALSAWSFRMNLDAEPRLQRHVVVLTRREG